MKRALLLFMMLAAASAPALGGPQLPVTVESLGLRFHTPKGWRLLPESSPDELVLAPGKSKTRPLLRVLAFRGRLSARDRIPRLVATLEGEEQLVTFQSQQTWTLEGKSFETATALYKKGSREWYARFTLVDQPDKLQHGFWLFGRKQDLERQWPAVQASIRSALLEGAPPAPGSEGEDAPPPVETAFVWRDVKSGLRVAAWPAGYTPDEASLSRLSSTGIVLSPSDPDAPPGAEMRLARRSVGELVSAESTADTLEERLGDTIGVRDLKRLKVRVAGEPAASLRWTQIIGADEHSFEVWLWKHGSSLYRLDSQADKAWIATRKRRDLVKKFTGALSFP